MFSQLNLEEYMVLGHLFLNGRDTSDPVKIVTGDGGQVKKFGSTQTSSYSQPTAIAREGNSIFVLDTGHDVVTLITGFKGMVTYLQNLGILYDAFLSILKTR